MKDDVKLAQLLNLFGNAGLDVFNAFDFEEHEKYSFNCVLEKFDSYCCLKKYIVFERFTCCRIKQEEGQDFGQFVTQLKLSPTSCEFLETENVARD